MKRLMYALVLMLGVFLNASAQDANSILGLYLVEGGRGKVQISREGDKYVGTLVWTIENGALDTKNPDKAEHKKPLKGKKILQNFVYTGKGVWEQGTIYDPDSGKTYSCKITRQKDGSLKVRGFIGVSLLGRNSIWKPI
ncbi:MAG: DUF2147 domain-containing protein [Porphyromonas sp.]|nr:DUF2147 domain-containing protein [Porphyromonas sp.]